MTSAKVRVERGLSRHIRQESTAIVIRVSGVREGRRALEVLNRVVPWIEGMGVRFVAVFPGPEGALVYLDGKGVGVKRLLTIPDRVAQACAEGGLDGAVVGRAKSADDDPDFPWELSGCVSMTLLAERPAVAGGDRAVPESWVAAGYAWWREQASSRKTWVSLVGNVYPMAEPAVGEMLGAIVSSRSGTTSLVAGTPAQGAACLACQFTLAPGLTLKLAGVPDSELLVAAERFVDIVRRCASELVYGVVEFVPTFHPEHGRHHPVWRELEPRINVSVTGDYVDHAFDAFPFQVLSEGHLRRLPELSEGEPLPGGRVGLSLGEMKDWLPGRDVAALQEPGRALLAPCLRQKWTPPPVGVRQAVHRR
jgi:hypothetical protein